MESKKVILEKEETPDFSNYVLNGKKLDLYKYTSKYCFCDVLMGVTIENSHLYASDGFVLIKIKDNRYNKLSGKTISKKGEFITKSRPDFESIYESLRPNKVYDFKDSKILTKTHSKLGDFYYESGNIKRIEKIMKIENIKKLYQCVNGILFVVSSNICACCMYVNEYKIGDEFIEYNVPVKEISVPISEILESEGFKEKETKEEEEQTETKVISSEENERTTQTNERTQKESEKNTTDEQIQEPVQTDEQTDEQNEQFCAAPEYCLDMTLYQVEFYTNSTLDTYTQIEDFAMCENIAYKQDHHTHKNISNVYLGTFRYFQVFLGTRRKLPYFSAVKPYARLPNKSIYIYSDLTRKYIAHTRQMGEYLLNTFPLSLSNGYRMATEGLTKNNNENNNKYELQRICR